MRHGSLFSGIGGFDLAAQWMGWENVFHCEWNEFGQKVLKYYWPKAISYGDITKTDFTIWRGLINVLSGGFPCQPNSRAGNQNFQEDERHLWPEFFRAVDEIRPDWVVGENVPGIVDNEYSIEEIKRNIESINYHLLPIKIPANVVGTNHTRERIWFIAYSGSLGLERRIEGMQTAHEQRSYQEGLFARRVFTDRQGDGLPRPRIFRADNGLSKRLAIKAIQGYGNAIVPQVAYEIFKAIEMTAKKFAQ